MGTMSCHGNNATPPSPAEAPGAESIDVLAEGRRLGQEWPQTVGRRLAALVPGFDAPFFQAGLAGYSDAAMRLVAREHGCPFCVTEALLDRMLLGGGRGFDKADLGMQHGRVLDENLPLNAADHPLAGQIIGSDPDEMAAAALKMIEQGRRRSAKAYRDMAYGEGRLPQYVDTRWRSDDTSPEPSQSTSLATAEDATVEDGVRAGAGAGASAPTETFATIDVNLACPVKKIDRKHRGGHWLTEPTGAVDILKTVRAAVPPTIPCTVKLRRSYDDSPEMVANFYRIYDAAYELGYAWTTVHARTVEQRYIGPSRWTFLRDLVARDRSRLVFGSGDVWEAADVVRMIAYSGVSGVSVARGCIGNPWIFHQARALLRGQGIVGPTIAQQRAALWSHFRLSVAINGEQAAGKMMRKFGIKFAQHHPQADRVKQAMISVNTTADWQAVLEAWYGRANVAG